MQNFHLPSDNTEKVIDRQRTRGQTLLTTIAPSYPIFRSRKISENIEGLRREAQTKGFDGELTINKS